MKFGTIRRMKITLPSGVVLDDSEGACDTLRQRIGYWGLKNLRVFVATDPARNNAKEYLLVEGQTPIYSNQSSESVWAHIDIMGLDNKFSK